MSDSRLAGDELPDLRIQSVLYRNENHDVRRSLDCLARAVELARTAKAFGSIELAFGDCSPSPVFTTAEIDELRAALAAFGIDALSYTFFDANLGSAAGHNRLFERLARDYVLILNPDTMVAPNLLIELMKPFSRPGIGLVEARQIPIEHPKAYDRTTGEASWATTACALIPHAVVRKVGAFDSESFFLYCDDVDYSWRIRLAGYKIIFQPSATIFHDKRLSDAGGWIVGAAEEYYSAEGGMMMAQKYGPSGLADEIQRNISLGGTESQKRAAAAFGARRDLGTLPAPVEGRERVAEFIGPNYGRHRW